MTERERAAAALHLAELELERATAAAIRRERGSRERLRWAKLAMERAHRRGLRALDVDWGSETSDGADSLPR
jgi:hypothetical protein